MNGVNHSTILGRAIALTLSLCAVASAQTPLRIGLSFDTGGKNDKSFNQASWVGAQRAAKEFGVKISNFEPNESSQVGQGIRTFAKAGHDLVIGVGFANNGPIQDNAKTYPGQKFAVVDDLPKGANTTGLRFAEEQGSFLVGFIAGNSTSTGVVGFVGGMDIPLIHKFEAGYRAGVLHVCPDCRVVAQYAGVTPEAFKNPTRGKELALTQYGSGVNVIFHASGSTGLGVFEAARSTGKKAIGVDADQYGEAPGYVLTSMVKRVDEAVFDAVQLVQQGRFRGGVRVLGLKERGVDYVYDARNKALIPDAARARVELLRDSIIAGHIRVPSTR